MEGHSRHNLTGMYRIDCPFVYGPSGGPECPGELGGEGLALDKECKPGDLVLILDGRKERDQGRGGGGNML